MSSFKQYIQSFIIHNKPIEKDIIGFSFKLRYVNLIIFQVTCK